MLAWPPRCGLPKQRDQCRDIAQHVLDRQFPVDAPNQTWAADFNYIWTAESWLSKAAVLDMYSQQIVGWSKRQSMISQWVGDALMSGLG